MLWGGQRAQSAKLRGIKHGGGRFKTYPPLCYTLYEVQQEELCMNCSNFRFTLDMQSSQSQVSVPVALGDTSRTLYISLSDGGKPYFISDGCLAMLSIKRPTGTFIQEYCLIEHNTNIKYDFTQNENTAAVEGFHDCQITLYDEDGGIVSTPRFTMIVNEKVINSDDINISDEDKTAIDNMIAAEVARQDAEKERVQADAARRMELDAFKASVNAALDSLQLAAAVITEITLYASEWVGDASPYSQELNIEGVTEYSKVDLQPDADLLAIFHEKDLALVAENEDGVVTVYAIGDKPTRDYTMQASITEVSA